jgi:cellulose synthase/poly-beta-1,6-N-acetylglucosamine synthase-like glycosyltransferase
LLEIQVLDDSTDETVGLCAELVSAYRAQGIDIRHVRRSNRQGYKAGALRDGLAQARGEFVAIFDADFTPESDFLRNTLPHFADPRVGVVQTRWGHLNDGYSFLTRGQALGLDGHFVIEQAARNRNNLFINFNGTGGVWRKTAILDSGNWQDDTLTEDMDLSYRAQLRGWRFVYLDNVVCKGEIPAEVNAFKVQQHRWAKGAVQTAKKILPQVWRRPDLRFMVKIQATIHLTNHLVFPVLVAVALSTFPLLILKATASRFHGFFVFASLFTLGAFSYPALYLYSQRVTHSDWLKRVLYLPLVMGGGIGIAVNNSKAFFGGLFNLKGGFNRTPKYRIEDRKDKWNHSRYRAPFSGLTLVELFLSGYCFVTVIYALQHREFAALPFLLLYFIGFTYIGSLSLLHSLKR